VIKNFGEDVHNILDFRRTIEQRSVPGGTAMAVAKALLARPATKGIH
jgi:hypothetical protein